MHTKWNLKLLYNSDTDPNIEKDIQISKRKVTSFVKKWKNNKQYLKEPTILKKALEEYEKLSVDPGICDKPIYYFLLLNNLDQTNTAIKGRLNSISHIAQKLSNDIQFFELNISKVSKTQQEKFLKSPLLKEYKHFLESLFASSEYILSDREEKVFNLTSKTSHSNWKKMVEELLDKQELELLDEDGKRKKVGYTNINKYLNSTNKKVREYAAKQYNEVNDRYTEIAEFEINSILERKQVSDEYRNVPRPDVLRHIGDDIETEVVDTLVDVVSKNFHISKEFYKLKAKLLKQNTLGYYERNVPMGETGKQYPFDNGMNLVKDSFKNIDGEFLKILNQLEENGQYDIFPMKGKSNGGFCISINKNLPTYILTNYNEELNDVLTIAHESGHAIHFEMSKTQNSLNCVPPISLAEIASTFFEDFVLEEILKEADEKTKLTILAQKLNSDISAIFRQVAFYNFEKELHSKFREEGYLSKEYISNLFCKHMKAYMGSAVLEDDSMRSGWIYVSHFRRFFYVYAYASGLLISKALQSMVRDDKKNVRLVKEFLSSGSTKSPKELFKDMGIDIMRKEFWRQGLTEIEKSVNDIK